MPKRFQEGAGKIRRDQKSPAGLAATERREWQRFRAEVRRLAK
jgi:hypothetical protein